MPAAFPAGCDTTAVTDPTDVPVSDRSSVPEPASTATGSPPVPVTASTTTGPPPAPTSAPAAPAPAVDLSARGNPPVTPPATAPPPAPLSGREAESVGQLPPVGTEDRVKGHIAICVLAAVIEAVIGNRLAAAGVRDPDLPDQTISARRALAELNRVRVHHLDTGDHHIDVITRRNSLQTAICAALDINTHHWDNARVT